MPSIYETIRIVKGKSLGYAEIRKSPLGWDEYYMQIADAAAKRSKDPNTKVGAVIVAGNMQSVGYNGFPRKVRDYEQRWKRPYKYDFVVHAELNAIFNANIQAIQSDKKSTIYTTHDPCNECAKAIIQVGIKRVVTKGLPTTTPKDKIKIGEQMMSEAGVQVIRYKGK